MSAAIPWLVYGGGALLLAGGSIAFGLAMRPSGPLGRALARHTARLDAECRFQCYSVGGREFLVRQLWALVFSIAACVHFQETILWFLPLLVTFGPSLALRRLRRKRIEAIERQIDGWLLVLANLLRTAGGLGDAIATSVDLVRPPLRQELDRVLKEIRLGATLDDALRRAAENVKSPLLSAVVTILLVGRRTGGELPGLLETAAAALREMARLEGVIRTKTAEGKIQVMILAVTPIGMIFAFRVIDPHFFDPLVSSLLGYCVLAAATVLWLLSLLSARKILNVDY